MRSARSPTKPPKRMANSSCLDFGKLVRQKRKARTGFNPKTQQKIKIPAKTVLKFRVFKVTKDAILGVKKWVLLPHWSAADPNAATRRLLMNGETKFP